VEKSTLIYQKLEAFIKKYYSNELLRGTIFFVGLGLIYFIFTLFVEYFLWLKPNARTFLFWIFIHVEIFLLSRFIIFPLFKLFKIQKGIDYNDASRIIGNHFNEVGDKLTNFLQLSKESYSLQNHLTSELLLASIDQKAKTLQPIPFTSAINLSKNSKYLPLAIIPILFFAFFYLSGKGSVISQSFNRVVNYKTQFLPPAPFSFKVLNSNLQTEQGKDFLLQIASEGNVIPESATIIINNESYFLESVKSGIFQYRFTKPIKNIEFHVKANEVESTNYTLNVVAVPTISNFQMLLQYPSYLNKKSEIIKGTGNAIVPEGTTVSWQVEAIATDNVIFLETDTRASFFRSENRFKFLKQISKNIDYQIITSNKKVKDFERLSYQIATIKDQFPTIDVQNAPDSLKVDKKLVIGKVGDDIGISKLQIVYYPNNNPKAAFKANLPVNKALFDQFVFSFPGNLPVQEGINYDYYFQVFDNDALHNYKSARSSVFSSRITTAQEKEDQFLQQQNENIDGLQHSLDNQEKQLKELDRLGKSTKEKNSLEYKDQQKIDDFIKRQKKQDEMMKEFTKKMSDDLEKTKSPEKEEFKKDLEKRIESSKEDLEKNKKLLDELKELNDKIQQEQLVEKMDKFKQNSKNQTKTLEQLVELTKKFYVEKKAQQLVDKLNKLANKQEDLSKKDKENTEEKQNEINKEFEAIQEELKELSKENKELKSPVDLPENAPKQKSIEDDLNKASDELQKQDKAKAKAKQKSAAQKMKEMSQDMASEMGAGEQEQMEEDVAMLRQILDNLLSFSFSQEEIMKEFKTTKRLSPSFNKNLKLQQDLKLQFQHVDDSLFALSLRNPKIEETITKEIGNIHYNIQKSIETLVESQISKGVSHQQFTVSSSNKLADMLSETLNNMKMSMSGMGKGKPKPGEGDGMQLPDIIKKQEKLGEKMKEGMKKGEKPGQKPSDKPGNEGKEGSQGSQGKEGGKTGKDQPGQNGKSGGNDGNSNEDGEQNAREIMEIYKEQRDLRERLQDELNKKGLSPNGQNALNQMKQIEKQLLDKGFKNEVLQRILNVKHELLKLQLATQQQGEEQKRQAETSKTQFTNPTNTIPASLKEYLNSIEILNRQTLPLQEKYNQKVHEYFKTK
jgi:hypothetical protein